MIVWSCVNRSFPLHGSQTHGVFFLFLQAAVKYGADPRVFSIMSKVRFLGPVSSNSGGNAEWTSHFTGQFKQLPTFRYEYSFLSMRAWENFNRRTYCACSLRKNLTYSKSYSFSDLKVGNREITKRRRYKTMFSEQKQWLCTCVWHFGSFLCRRLLNVDVKWLNSGLCGGHKHMTMNFQFSLNLTNPLIPVEFLDNYFTFLRDLRLKVLIGKDLKNRTICRWKLKGCTFKTLNVGPASVWSRDFPQSNPMSTNLS